MWDLEKQASNREEIGGCQRQRVEMVGIGCKWSKGTNSQLRDKLLGYNVQHDESS